MPILYDSQTPLATPVSPSSNVAMVEALEPSSALCHISMLPLIASMIMKRLSSQVLGTTMLDLPPPLLVGSMKSWLRILPSASSVKPETKPSNELASEEFARVVAYRMVPVAETRAVSPR